MADDQAIWRDAGPSQLERLRRPAVGEQLFAAAKHDRHREDAHSVDQVIGEQRVDEFGTAAPLLGLRSGPKETATP